MTAVYILMNKRITPVIARRLSSSKIPHCQKLALANPVGDIFDSLRKHIDDLPHNIVSTVRVRTTKNEFL